MEFHLAMEVGDLILELLALAAQLLHLQPGPHIASPACTMWMISHVVCQSGCVAVGEMLGGCNLMPVLQNERFILQDALQALTPDWSSKVNLALKHADTASLKIAQKQLAGYLIPA